MMDELRDIFFVESEDLLAAMSDGLAALAEGSADAETLNAVFRAVHSIKGAAGAFTLTDVVSFAHSFETVLDSVRSGALVPDGDVVHLLQRAGDILAALLERAREDRPDPPEALAAILDALEELAGGEGDMVEDFSFEPVGLASALLMAEASPPNSSYELLFRPGRHFYRNGHEPLHLFAALAEMGELAVTCDTSGIPPLASLQLEDNYLTWTLRLGTTADEGQVREVFVFVEDLCDLTIIKIDDAALPAPPEPLSLADAGLVPDPVPNPGPAAELPPSPSAPAGPSAGPARDVPRPTLRVDLERVDRLINSVGELIISQAVIAQKIAEAGLPPSSGIGPQVDDLSQLARDIQDGVMRIRAQPVKPLFQRIARVVREAAEATGKVVEFLTEGEDTEVDRAVIEGLADPLTHMIRNAVDHGIEAPAERLARSKPPSGRLVLSTAQVSGNLRIVVRDDGAGLDRARIKATAVRKGLIAPDANLSESEIDNLLFLPGFSTASSVTNLSGRGVGMDVARTAITTLGGRIGIASRPGEGTAFTISLPLTLAVLDGLIVEVGSQPMVISASAVVETIRPSVSDLTDIGQGEQALEVRGMHVPVIEVASLLGFGPVLPPGDAIMVLVRTSEDAQAALAISGISDKRQVVIKSLRRNVGAVAGVSAATILGDGKVALILDPDALVALSARRPSLSSAFLDNEHEHAA